MGTANGYSPVVESAEGLRVVLGRDHPGFADPDYRRRRDEIASMSAGWEPGAVVPTVEYTGVEHDVWRVVAQELAVKHRKYGCQAYLEASEASGPARGPCAATRRGDRQAGSPHRFPVLARGRFGAAEGVLWFVRRPQFLLHPVPPAPLGPALHARARHRPRGGRSRKPIGQPSFRCHIRRGGQSRRSHRVARGTRLHVARVLVHDRVWCRAGSRRTESVRCGHPFLFW